MASDGALNPLDTDDTGVDFDPDILLDAIQQSGGAAPAPASAPASAPAAAPASAQAAGAPAGGAAFAGDAHALQASLQAVYDVPVTVQAILGRSRMKVSDLIALRSGEVIELDRRVGEPVDILVNGRLIARGEVVTIDGALGITLTEIVRREEK